MRKIPARRLLSVLFVFAAGIVLGGTFASASQSNSPVIDVTTYGEVLDVDGKVVVEDGQGFVVFTDAAKQVAKVAVRGWDAQVKRGLLREGSTVRVTGADDKGKAKEYHGHVTVLK